MASIVTQQVLPVTAIAANLVATKIKLTSAADSVTLPRMRQSTNSVVQLRRPGDATVTVSQSSFTNVNLTGSVGDEILLVSFHDDPIPNPTV